MRVKHTTVRIGMLVAAGAAASAFAAAIPANPAAISHSSSTIAGGPANASAVALGKAEVPLADSAAQLDAAVRPDAKAAPDGPYPIAYDKVAIASVLTGLSTTSPPPPLNTYWICQPDAYCIANTPHGDIWTMTTNPDDWGIFNFNSEYIDSNGSTWYQIQENQSDLCLNWDPSNNWVYADSCPPGDPNELWSNHPGYQFDNLAAASRYRMDAWLTNAETGNLGVQVSPVNPSIWGEGVPS